MKPPPKPPTPKPVYRVTVNILCTPQELGRRLAKLLAMRERAESQTAERERAT